MELKAGYVILIIFGLLLFIPYQSEKDYWVTEYKKYQEPYVEEILINGKVIDFQSFNICLEEGSLFCERTGKEDKFTIKNFNKEYGGQFILTAKYKPLLNLNLNMLGLPVDAELFEDKAAMRNIYLKPSATGEAIVKHSDDYILDTYSLEGDKLTSTKYREVIAENKVLKTRTVRKSMLEKILT